MFNVVVSLPLCSMKRRRLLISPPLLPTITETLEDVPAHPAASQPNQSSQSLEDYMSSIQALACPAETPHHCTTARFQKNPRLRHHSSRAPVKLSNSASHPRGSPRMLRTPRPYSLNLTEDLSVKLRGKDPVDWLFGQIRTWAKKYVKHKHAEVRRTNMSRSDAQTCRGATHTCHGATSLCSPRQCSTVATGELEIYLFLCSVDWSLHVLSYFGRMKTI